MKNLFKALSDFQNEVPPINKKKQGYGYKYAELHYINEVVNPVLKKNKLSYAQPIIDGGIKTILCHWESGETLESFFEIPKGVSLKGMNDFQVIGSGVTHFRRYALSSILGIASEEDNDMKGVQLPKKNKEIEEKIKNAKDLQELSGIYSLLDNEQKKLYTASFSQKKLELNGN